MFDPYVTIGSVKEKEAYDWIDNKWMKKQRKFPINKPLKIATSNSRATTMQADLIKGLQATNVKAGGSGRKVCINLSR